MADDQKMGSKVSSGGRRIDDHSAWMGSRGKDVVMPDGAKTKKVSSTNGFGSLDFYEDTNETLVAQQELAKKKVHGHPMKRLDRH